MIKVSIIKKHAWKKTESNFKTQLLQLDTRLDYAKHFVNSSYNQQKTSNFPDTTTALYCEIEGKKSYLEECHNISVEYYLQI